MACLASSALLSGWIRVSSRWTGGSSRPDCGPGGFHGRPPGSLLLLLPRQVDGLGEADKDANLAIVFGLSGTVGLLTALVARHESC
jgi:hypothetical protein